MSRADDPSAAGTFCSASKYARQRSGTDPGLSKVRLVELLDVRRVAAEQVRVRPAFLHHLAHLSHRFPVLQWVSKPSALRLRRLTD